MVGESAVVENTEANELEEAYASKEEMEEEEDVIEDQEAPFSHTERCNPVYL